MADQIFLQQKEVSQPYLLIVYKVNIQMFEPNLIKPPKILEEIESQDSESYTQKPYNKSNRGKHSSKQNTIRISSNGQPQIPLPRDYDNESVHSNASGKSKGKKTKESTLARPKIMNNLVQNRDQDSHSVHSNASKNSHKSGKKQNSIMPKPKIETGGKIRKQQNRNMEPDQKFTSFKSAWKDDDESVIKPYKLQNKVPVKNSYEPTTFKEKEKKNSKGKFAPFAEIQQQSYSDDEPVIKLVQPSEYDNKQLFVGAKKHQEVSKNPIQSRMIFDESNVIFGESKMRQTKSRRRNIFQKSSHFQNTSKVSQSIAESSISGLAQSSQRSKSKRREIFNNSRERQRKESQQNKKILQNESKMLQIGTAGFQSKDLSSAYRKPSPKKASDFHPIQKKVLAEDNDEFGLESSKSDLDLSTSNHLRKADPNDRDSLILHLQPQKKKGVSIVGVKNAKQVSRNSNDNMLQISNNNLVSVNGNQAKNVSKDMLKVHNNLVSKEIQDVKKILNANQEYLANIPHIALADSYEPTIKVNKKQQFNTLNIKKYEEFSQNQKPWHQVVNEFQHVERLNIKKVQRNEKIVNKAQDTRKQTGAQKAKQEESQQRLREAKKQRQRQKQRERERQKQKEWERKRQEQQRKREEEEQERRKEQQQRKRQEERERRQRQRQRERQRNEKVRRQAELKRKREFQQQKQRQLQKQQKIEDQRKKLLRQERISEQKLRRQNQDQKRRIAEKLEQQQQFLNRRNITQLNNLPSEISREDFSQNSEQSNKSKKHKQKKQSSLTRDKNHKAYVRNQSPRGQESFYQSSVEQNQSSKLEQKKEDNKQDKRPKLLSFQEEDYDLKPKSRTDINFYDNAPSQKSFKPPSSKPPLSRRTNGSGGSLSKEKKPKEKTIAINVKQQSLKPSKPNHAKQQKKMSLMDRALLKHNEESSNGSYSQDSCKNRDDIDSEHSRNSNSSKQSKGSLKKQSTLKISKQNMIYSKYGKAPYRRQSSNSGSHEEQLQNAERERIKSKETDMKTKQISQMKQQIINDRVIVTKNCTFIDEKGKLVTQDLVIKGKEVYGIPQSQKNIDQVVLQRMKRSREDRRSRSKSRQRNKLNDRRSREGSQNESSNENSSYASSSFYQNNSKASLKRNESNPGIYTNYGVYGQTNTLKQFIKPVQQIPNMYDQRNRKIQVRHQEPNQPKTLNDMFSRKNNSNMTNNNNSMQSSRSRKSLGRTQKTFNKK